MLVNLVSCVRQLFHGEVTTGSDYYLRRSHTTINTLEQVVVKSYIWCVTVQFPIWCVTLLRLFGTVMLQHWSGHNLDLSYYEKKLHFLTNNNREKKIAKKPSLTVSLCNTSSIAAIYQNSLSFELPGRNKNKYSFQINEVVRFVYHQKAKNDTSRIHTKDIQELLY